MPLFGRTGHPATGGPPEWQPIDIGGSVLWLRSDLGIIKDGSGRVGTWADQSDSNNHATQTDDSKKYIFTPNDLGNFASLVGDGSNDVMNANGLCPTLYGTNSFTFFGIVKSVDPISWEYPYPFMFSTAGGVPKTFLMILNADTIRFYRASLEYGNQYLSALHTFGGWDYYVLTFGGRYSTLRINGSALWVDADVMDGTMGTGLDAFYFESINVKQHWVEMGFYDNVISSPNVTLLENYIQTRYSL